MKKISNTVEYFWSNVVKTSSCWLWVGSKQEHGYGRFQPRKERGGKARNNFSAHRFSYELKYGSILGNMSVLHKCDNPPCVNPSHLFLGTQAENVKDMTIKNRVSHGEKHFNHKLTVNEVREIKFLRKNKKMRIFQLANQFGFCRQTVADIVNNRTWVRVKI